MSSSNIQRIPSTSPPTILLSTVPVPCPHLQTEDVPRKFHGSSICCRWGSLFSYWWVSRSAGLCGFQQAPQRLPDGPSQDVAYCGCVSMGALQMEPPGVIRLLRRGVREGMGGGGLYEQQGVGDGHIFEVDQSLWTVMGWFSFFFGPSLLLFFTYALRRFGKGNKRLLCHLPLNVAVGLREYRIIFAAAAGGGGAISRSVHSPNPPMRVWFMKENHFYWGALINLKSFAGKVKKKIPQHIWWKRC